MPWVTDNARCPWPPLRVPPGPAGPADMTSIGLFIRAADGFIEGHTYLILSRTDGGVFARDLTADFGAPSFTLDDYDVGENVGYRFPQRSSRWPNFPHVRFVDGNPSRFVVVWVAPTDIIKGEFETFFPTFGIDEVTMVEFSYGGQVGAETVTIPYGESPVLPKLAMTEVSRTTARTNEVILRTLNLEVFENLIRRDETWDVNLGGDCVIDSVGLAGDGLVVTGINALSPTQVQYGISNPLSIYPRLDGSGNLEVLALYTGLSGCELPLTDITLTGFTGGVGPVTAIVNDWFGEFTVPQSNYGNYRNQQNFSSAVIGSVFRFPYYYVVNLTTKTVVLRTIAASTSLAWAVYWGSLNRGFNQIDPPGGGCPGGITPTLNFVIGTVSETNWTPGVGTLGVPWYGLIMDTLPANPYLAEPWKTEWTATTALMHRERIAQTHEVVFNEFSGVWRSVLMVAPQALVAPDAFSTNVSLVFTDVAGGGAWPETGVYEYQTTWTPAQAGLSLSPGRRMLFRVDDATKSVGISGLNAFGSPAGDFRLYRRKHPSGAWSRVAGPANSISFTDTGAAGAGESPGGGSPGGHTDHYIIRDQEFFHDTPQHPVADTIPHFAMVIQRSGEFSRLANLLAAGSLPEAGGGEDIPPPQTFLFLGSRWGLIRERGFPDALALLDRQNLARYAIDQASVDEIHVGPDPLMDLDLLMSKLRFQYAGGDTMGVTLGQGVDLTLKKALAFSAAGTMQRVNDVNTPADPRYPRVGKTPDSNGIHVQYQDGQMSVPAVETQNMPS